MIAPPAAELFSWGVGGVLASALLVRLVQRLRGRAPLTIADRITILRLVLIAPTIWCLVRHYYIAAALCYLALITTDVADGIVARRRGETGAFGVFMDPLADILSTFAVFTVFVADGFIPAWLYVLLLVRYLMLGVGSLILTRASGPIDFHSTVPGKIVGVVQASVALWIMVRAARGVATPAGGPLFAFLAVGFVSIVVSQTVLGYRHVRRAPPRARG